MKNDDFIFRLKSLNIKINEKNIIRDIDFDVNYNSIHSFIGESGSGKTISTRGLFGYHNIENIKINFEKLYFSGKTAELKDIKTQTRFIFQDPEICFSPLLKLKNQIFDGFKNIKEAEIVFDNYLKDFSLNFSDFINKYPFEISGGMKQKIIIALALSKNPELLVADEVTSNLDSVSGLEVLNILKKLKDKISVIFITHNIMQASYISDFISVFYKGMIVENGSTQQILDNPLHFYTKYLLNNILSFSNEIDKDLSTNSIQNLMTTNSGCPFFYYCPEKKYFCKTETPKKYFIDNRMVRCFYYE